MKALAHFLTCFFCHMSFPGNKVFIRLGGMLHAVISLQEDLHAVVHVAATQQ